ncbi:hypothetical protein [Bosea rubneri]|uniref:Uncharacterized protein n=1 Tax=Bosea rubneri TaxID=3075434 RepID=A0ABU3SBB0_9HYPH|nr:hypothetical protein [Bosea sp. ZW T0_25]MDU0342062.1 hypothetical protein [Bosea sp. ZW T0_25]
MFNEIIAVEIKDGRIFIDDQAQGLERDDQERVLLLPRAGRRSARRRRKLSNGEPYPDRPSGLP